MFRKLQAALIDEPSINSREVGTTPEPLIKPGTAAIAVSISGMVRAEHGILRLWQQPQRYLRDGPERAFRSDHEMNEVPDRRRPSVFSSEICDLA